ncbi:MAG: EAL domain-containing protein [Hydrogenophaga sp.]|uniref:sensor domain-containing protein n=1 Tax=Hydrogenophaga sp. TaxID=1904254 RepID=UPI002750893A|nr:EAL domain-containing protein [Hydrogenophaga sp.]MDP2418006.1 EAL domain-containing protein [Hydrogenophaga sp.]MDZ4187183.1 EAL domain-containing protein [Hydrogenophaga sp.]
MSTHKPQPPTAGTQRATEAATPSGENHPDLRQQALAKLQQFGASALPVEDEQNPQQLQEELRTHQIELEIQNEELRQTQFRAELASSRYQLLFEHMPQPALVIDQHAFMHESNHSARDWLGLGSGVKRASRHTPHATSLLHALQQTGKTQLRTLLRAGQRQQTQCLRDLTLTTHDGQLHHIDLHLFSLPLAYHSDSRFLVLLVDRTPEKQREQDRHLYQALLDSSHDLIYATDLQGGLMLANRTVLERLNINADQAQGTRRETVMPLRDAIVQDATDQQVLRTGQPINTYEELHGPPGSPVQVYMTNKFPLLDAEGQVLGVGGISRDITAERAAQQTQLLSENVFLFASEAIIVTDMAGRIVRVNAGFEKMSGFTSASVLGHKPSLLRSSRVGASVYKALWAALGEHGHWQGELINRHASGSLYTVHCSISALRSPTGELNGYVAVQTDVSQLKAAETEVQRLSHFDSLTGLPNRALLMDRLHQLLALAQRQGQTFGVLFADLDHFKEVNDSLGHLVGDELLCAIGQRLRDNVRSQDTVARMGGDEFVVLLPMTQRTDALNLAHKLQDALRQPLSLSGMHDYRPRASVGVAMYPEDGDTSDELLRNADTAMYVAKTSGRDRAELYTRAMSEEGARVFAIQTELSNAMQHNELRMYLQPKFSLADMSVVGAEALVRWERPAHGLTSPAEFIPIAEKVGLLPLIDHWMLTQMVTQLGQWYAEDRWPAHWTVSINQTASDLQQPHWLSDLQQTLADNQVPACLVQIELTESALLQPTPSMLERLQALRDLGVDLAIDDFGTGYSSLSYLKSLPITSIKIDQSFISDLVLDPPRHLDDSGRVLIEAMIALAHKLGHTLVAEGVENEAQRRLLHHLGCELGQGYLLSPPMPAAEFARRYLAPPARA